ncbi:tRNA pseudouridine synthase A [Poritiphilus flavus]|uniref:tRNA pseudouridine synthase A n=1 Tax=Poritiphilus flavus TaxID=2697053 RepID=A0A6L9EFW1_9FLAO|nr:tRNA pseudouridine(38-40) synthase TruA [Poritiphilus flavus]NAS13635.1 tRNA pseudouridine(38-40) synthase TruA [Poritiphilus flavus]
MDKRYYYLIRLQYLGFRYSGWQKQPEYKTIEGMLLKTLKFALPERDYKILGAGRTDAKVSAEQAAFELFLKGAPLVDMKLFLETMNSNLPPDIKLINIDEVNENFNIINQSKIKEYHYFFSYGSKNHPFCAPLMANFLFPLDIDLMKHAATLFAGTYDLRAYTTRSNENKQFVRTITACELVENTLMQASFFPEKSYVLKVSGPGFMRYQIRMIMGALVELGRGALSLDTIKQSLQPNSDVQFSFVAPGSGLQLARLEFHANPL